MNPIGYEQAKSISVYPPFSNGPCRTLRFVNSYGVVHVMLTCSPTR